MSSNPNYAPPILVHLIEREPALHAQVVLLTVLTDSSPQVPASQRLETRSLGNGIYQVIARFGFMQESDVPTTIQEAAQALGITVDAQTSTYYLGRETVLAKKKSAMGAFAESLFSYLQRNAVTADRNFKIPPRQVIEIGIQVDL
jgi:KUP system potassium uptake protein